jgi:hypothetical protein
MIFWGFLFTYENSAVQKELTDITINIISETVLINDQDFEVNRSNGYNIKAFKLIGNELLQTEATYNGTQALNEKLSNDIIDTYIKNRRLVSFDLLKPYYTIYDETLEQDIDVQYKAGDTFKIKDLSGNLLFGGITFEIISIENKYKAQLIKKIKAVEVIEGV